MFKFKMIFRTCLIFMIAFMVYEKRAYIDVCYGGIYPEKNGYNRNNLQSFQVRTLNPLQRINFCEFYPLNLNSEF